MRHHVHFGVIAGRLKCPLTYGREAIVGATGKERPKRRQVVWVERISLEGTDVHFFGFGHSACIRQVHGDVAQHPRIARLGSQGTVQELVAFLAVAFLG